jgi:hypothetical protein
MRLITTAAITAAIAFSSYACGTNAPSAAGNLRLQITDLPYSDADAFLVTFSEVTAHRSEEGWSKLPFAAPDATTSAPTSFTCDLKKLENGNTATLGVGTLPIGHYTMIRLVVSSAKLFFDNPTAAGPACAAAIAAPAGASADVTVPSGEVKLNRQFELTAADSTEIKIDFDGGRSVVETGNGTYRLTPVISVLSVTPPTP